MAAACRFCGCTELYSSEARGETYCVKCGAVLEENRMVESVSFQETASGAKRAVGQFIPGGFAASYASRESREQALARGYTQIQKIADKLRLTMNLVEIAQRVYLLAVQRGFTAARPVPHVAAACLYVVCRREQSPHLMIDFSDVLRVPVRIIASVFVKMIRTLHIAVPSVDPALYMERFAQILSSQFLGDDYKKIALTGSRLVQAMNRDWICTGRRPLGLIGASLLIAARFHQVNINADDVSNVIRMAASTIERRLFEFRKTAVAQLPSSAVDSVDLLALPTLPEPPCREASRRRSARRPVKALQATAFSWSDGSEDESPGFSQTRALPAPSEQEREQEPEQDLSATLRDIDLAATAVELCAENPSGHDISQLAHKIVNAIGERVGASENVNGFGPKRNKPNGDVPPKGRKLTTESLNTNSDPLDDLLRGIGTEGKTLLEGTESSEPVDLGDILGDLTGQQSNSLAVLPTIDDDESVPHSDPEDEMREESLSDISDTEINQLLLSPEEKAAKTLIWDELTKDVMGIIIQRMKESDRREEALAASGKPRKKRRAKLVLEPAATAVDSVRLALEAKNKAVARRISGASLAALFRPGSKSGDNITDGNDVEPYTSLFD